MPRKWERYGTRAYVVREDYEENYKTIAYVHGTPFGWIAITRSKCDGFYESKAAAQKAAESYIDNAKGGAS